MGPVGYRELYSGTGSVAGRTDWLIVVHTRDAWRRIAPSLRAQRDLAELRFDWARSVALLVQAPPQGSSADSFHVRSISATDAGVEVLVELAQARTGAGPALGTPVLKPSLIVAEAEASAFGESVPVQLVLPGIKPPPSAVAHER